MHEPMRINYNDPNLTMTVCKQTNVTFNGYCGEVPTYAQISNKFMQKGIRLMTREISALLVIKIEERLIPAQLALPIWEYCAPKLHAIYRLCSGGNQCAS